MTCGVGYRAWLLGLLGVALLAQGQDAASLAARHAELRERLADNPFHHPLYLESRQSGERLHGEVYAELAYPYLQLSPVLQDLGQWCDLLILHLNVKGCQPRTGSVGPGLTLHIGKKQEQPLASAYPFSFNYRVRASPNFLQVSFHAARGPLGTSDYRILVEAMPLDGGRSFLHLSYAYDYGLQAHMAMRAYLASGGRDKVGFSIVGQSASGLPIYQGDIRGIIERNAMRYYLAIEAYMGSLSAPPASRIDRRLEAWQSAVERYPRQLHELERSTYLRMKQREIRRQQALNATVSAP